MLDGFRFSMRREQGKPVKTGRPCEWPRCENPATVVGSKWARETSSSYRYKHEELHLCDEHFWTASSFQTLSNLSELSPDGKKKYDETQRALLEIQRR